MSAASVTAFPRRTPPILLVADHDVLSRCRISDELRAYGFKVLEVSSAHDTITVFQTTRIDLLFADIDLPGPRNGLDVARYIRARGTPTQILLTSANLEGAAIPDLDKLGRFVQKPYSALQVVHLVSHCLNWPDSFDL